jgi:YXWGXW repeat-containing protein
MRSLLSVRSWLFALVVSVVSATSFAQVSIAIRIGPPALPVYEQPLCPAEGYIWTPGYWAYDYDYGDYYWVPGTWVLAPEPGFLWTPGYWGWGGDRFLFHEGYWGPRVGFYGGINYGFGYFGNGYEGGRWDHDRFFYNRSVNNINVTNIHNVYNTTVINNTTVNRVSYNGGSGGIDARPTREEEAAARDRHIPPVGAQTQHLQAARANPELRASANHGRPPVAATPRPGGFNERGAVPAREAGTPYRPEDHRGVEQPRGNTSVPRPENNVPRPPAPMHAKDVTPHPRPAAPNTGNAKLDQKYQQQQEKLYAKQQQEHQRLQQKQEQDHQRMAQQQANTARTQRMEQRHQQQTQQLEQRHVQQQQHMQQKQQPANRNQPKPPR